MYSCTKMHHEPPSRAEPSRAENDFALKQHRKPRVRGRERGGAVFNSSNDTAMMMPSPQIRPSPTAISRFAISA